MRELLGNGCQAVLPQANEMCMAGLRIEPEAHSTICGLVCDKDVGADVGAGRITGGHDGRPDDIGIAGDGIDSGGDGISWCWSGELTGRTG